MSIERHRQYQCLHHHLRMAHVMLLCAEESKPGPGRISPLWCASGRLDNAQRYALIFKLNSVPKNAPPHNPRRARSRLRTRKAGHAEHMIGTASKRPKVSGYTPLRCIDYKKSRRKIKANDCFPTLNSVRWLTSYIDRQRQLAEASALTYALCAAFPGPSPARS